MRNALVLVAAVYCGALMTGCTSEQEDVNEWMRKEAVDMVGKVQPLPELKIFPVVGYLAVSDVREPFDPARIQLTMQQRPGSEPPPEVSPVRAREPLEAFPLESLKMVGLMTQGKQVHALVQAEQALYQVHVGNFMGLDYGKITMIAEDAIELQEFIEDPNEGWVTRISSLQLQERQEEGK
ncbi:MAG: pilus assembly protein PilP [Azoarcus sp.]|jgi:type IV pilus assembly protein PilP|nr:pilus assembly protein PilP [Azoarcus sp.]